MSLASEWRNFMFLYKAIVFFTLVIKERKSLKNLHCIDQSNNVCCTVGLVMTFEPSGKVFFLFEEDFF